MVAGIRYTNDFSRVFYEIAFMVGTVVAASALLRSPAKATGFSAPVLFGSVEVRTALRFAR